MLTITDKIKLPPLPPHPNIAHEGGFHLHPDCQFTVLYKWAKDYARAAVEADRQSRPAASAEPRPDYSEMSREALERHAASMAQALADDKPRAFWERYAIGPKSAPSCICCGRIPDDVAVQHAEIPSIVVCRCCHDAATAPVAQELAASDVAEMATTRYRPVPDGLLRYRVVAGDGTRALFHGTKDECRIVSRRLTEAFLDGAYIAAPVAQEPAASAEPVGVSSPGQPDEAFNRWYEAEFKPGMERGPLDKYVARQAWFAALRAPVAPVVQEPVDFEHRHAIKQGERNEAEDKYFEARPEFDNKQDRRLFCDGFDRGYDAATNTVSVTAPVAQEPIATLHGDGCWTWKKPRHQHDAAFFKMDVYAAPVAAQPSVPEYPTRTGRAEGRLAGRPFQSGDVLPAPGSYCLVSGANCDIESDQHRGYSWRQVLGYSNDRQFICLQTNDCWPTVERTANCWFAEIPHPDGVAPTPPVVEPRLCPKCGADRSKVPCPGDLMNCPIRGEAQATVERPISDVLSDVVTQGIGIMRIDPTDIYQSSAKQHSTQAAIDAARKELP